MALQRIPSQETIHLLCASLEFHELCNILERLLYCSLHASATWIRVTVQQSDCSLIFEDDGVGISVDELESFQSTPLQEAILLVLENQLSENFTTFIRLVSSICDISVISRQPNQERSNYLEIRKGQVGHNPIHSLFSPYFLGHQIQAIASLSSLWKQSKHSYFLYNAMSLKMKVHLTNLFYSLPVRKQWLQTDRRQLYRTVHSTVLKFASMFPKCDFELHTQEATTSGALFRIYQKTGSWKSRLEELWGPEITSKLIPFQLETNCHNDKWIAQGFFSTHRSSRLSKQYSQILFLNNKPCHLNLQKQISNILNKISQERMHVATKTDRMEPGEPPFYIHLYIQKDKICSYTSEYIESNIVRILYDSFSASLLQSQSWDIPRFDATKNISRSEATTTEHQIDQSFDLLPKTLYSPYLQERNCPNLSIPTNIFPKKVSEMMKNLEDFQLSPSVYTPIGRNALELVESKVGNQLSTMISRTTFNEMQWIGVWNRSFLLFWAERVLYAMDQHAADERVQYENLQYQLLQMVKNDSIPTSSTYETESETYLQLSMKEYECANRYMNLLRKWGWKLAFESPSIYYGAPHVQILQMPYLPDILTTHSGILREQIQSIITTKNPDVIFQQIPKTILQELATKACHKAIKFGDSLKDQQIRHLLEQLKACKYPFQCAHGRPSIVPLLQLSN